MTTPSYTVLDTGVLQVTYPLSSNAWGTPRLSRIFNFEARQVTTLYERGGVSSFETPGYKTAKIPAVTAAMTVQNFSELDSPDEIIRMHDILSKQGGKPPPLDTILPDRMDKTPLKAPRLAQ